MDMRMSGLRKETAMKDSELREELRFYSEQHYMKPLTEAGFTNYRNDKLNWYQLYNGLICHLHIVSADSWLPMLMLIWWIQPTYLPAIMNPPIVLDRFELYMFFSANRAIHLENTVEPGHYMNVPHLPQRGAEWLQERLFPQMQRLNTREAVYTARRDAITSQWKTLEPDVPKYNIVTPEFADAALIMNDTEMFPSCIDRLENINIPVTRRIGDDGTITDRSLELLEAQLKALNGVDTANYFELLKERKARFLKRYKLQDDFEL